MVDCVFLAPARIDNQPVFRVGFPFEGLTNQPTHPRTGTIGPHQITGQNGVQFAVAFLYRGDNAFRLLMQIHQFSLGLNHHRSLRCYLLTQCTFQIRLIERHQLGMAIDGPTGIDPAKLTDIRTVHPHLLNPDPLEALIVQSHHLQDPQRFIIQRDGARQHQYVAVTIDH